MSRLNYEMLDQFRLWNSEDLDAHEYTKASYILDEIEKRKSKLKAKKELIDELTYESNLITEDIVKVIKEDLNYSYYNIFAGLTAEALYKTWKYFWYKNNKASWGEDKEKAKEEKKSCKYAFEYVLDIIKRKLLSNDDNYELVEILDSCFSTAYCFTYKYKDQTIQITIPNWSSATEDNYTSLLNGYMAHFKESAFSWGWITGNVDYRKVAEELAKWIKEKTNEDKE